MSILKCSKLPWRILDQREDPDQYYDYAIVDANDYYVAHIENCSNKEDEANAHLIERAPVLYDLLHSLLVREDRYPLDEATRNNIRYELARARGEYPGKCCRSCRHAEPGDSEDSVCWCSFQEIHVFTDPYWCSEYTDRETGEKVPIRAIDEILTK